MRCDLHFHPDGDLDAEGLLTLFIFFQFMHVLFLFGNCRAATLPVASGRQGSAPRAESISFPRRSERFFVHRHMPVPGLHSAQFPQGFTIVPPGL